MYVYVHMYICFFFKTHTHMYLNFIILARFCNRNVKKKSLYMQTNKKNKFLLLIQIYITHQAKNVCKNIKYQVHKPMK